MWHSRITAISYKPEMCIVVPASVNGRCALDEPLPSLSARFPLPEPHPDYHAVLASLHAKRMSQHGRPSHPNASRRQSYRDDNPLGIKSQPQQRQTTTPSSDHSPKTPCNMTIGQDDVSKQDNAVAGVTLRRLQTERRPDPLNQDGRPMNTGKAAVLAAQQQQQNALGDLTQLKTVSHSPTLPPAPPPAFWQHHAPSSYPSSPQAKQASVTSSTLLQKRANTGLLSASSLAEMGQLRSATIHPTDAHKVTSGRYATTADQRGYIPVFEYKVNGSTILIDAETSYVLLTSVCKAIGPFRSDIIRHVESVPELECLCRKVRGGFLKIQGTWVPYKLAYEICRRVAWQIRTDLIPIFGYDFPAKCLAPLDSGYGDLRILTASRRSRRSPGTSAAALPPERIVPHSQSPSNARALARVVLSPTFQQDVAYDLGMQQQQFQRPQPHQQLHQQLQQQPPAQSQPQQQQAFGSERFLPPSNSLLEADASPAEQNVNMQSQNGHIAKVDTISSLSTCARSYLSSHVDSGGGRMPLIHPLATLMSANGSNSATPHQQHTQPVQIPPSHSIGNAPTYLLTQTPLPPQKKGQNQLVHPQSSPQHSQQQQKEQQQQHQYDRHQLQETSRQHHYHPYPARSKGVSLANRSPRMTWSSGPTGTSMLYMIEKQNTRSSGPTCRDTTANRP